MNSGEVAKLLGVSISTVQRWVKQLNLPMERNERGHYTFKEEDIALLEKIQEQIQNGALLQEIAPASEKVPRKGIVKSVEVNPDLDKLMFMFSDLDRRIEGKADAVTSYQLLQHREEIEELQKKVAELTAKIEKMEEKAKPAKKKEPFPQEAPLVFDSGTFGKRQKKRNIIGMFLGF